MTPTTESNEFRFTLLRQVLVDATGAEVNEEVDDPEVWRLADALHDALNDGSTAPTLITVGHGRLAIESADESQFVEGHIIHNFGEGGQFIRARLLLDGHAPPPIGMGDLVLVTLAGGAALAYEVMLSSSDISIDVGWHASVSLPQGESILVLRDDLGMLTDDGDGPAEERAPAAAEGMPA